MKLDNILSEVTKTQKDKHGVYPLICEYSLWRLNMLQYTYPKRLGNKEGLRWDLSISLR